MQMNNPFPGMNPLLEGSWPDVQTALIVYICDVVSEELPLDLSARAEEEVTVGSESDEPLTRYRAEVAVAEPEIVELDHPTGRWVEIRDTDGRLVTVIEILSPTNKLGTGRAVYLQKQHNYLSGGVNLVEIDLLRIGRPAFWEDDLKMLHPEAGTRYLVAATRAVRPWRRELYYCPLRERLPAVRVPLRVTDLDVPLDLQPLIDRVYRTGRYWQISHREVPAPSLPTDDAAWVQERLLQ